MLIYLAKLGGLVFTRKARMAPGSVAWQINTFICINSTFKMAGVIFSSGETPRGPPIQFRPCLLIPECENSEKVLFA